MKILTAEQMRAADEAAMTTLEIPGRVLMENAGREIAQVVLRRGGRLLERGVVVIAGRGNNGGDGYVVARAIGGLGIPCDVLSLCPLKELKGDALENARVWAELGGSIVETNAAVWKSNDFDSKLRQTGVIVDALYGSGFRGPLSGFEAEMVERINLITERGEPLLIAVDVPSGISAGTGAVNGPALRAQVTVSLQCLKVAHVLHPAASFAGDVTVADIGIPEQLPEIANVPLALISEDVVRGVLGAVYGQRPLAHKGTRGHVVVIGGSPGHLGAVKMSGMAALKCGAGLGTLVLPREAARAVSAEVQELMCASLPDADEARSADGVAGHFAENPPAKEIVTLLSEKQAVVIGPGMGQGLGARDVLREVLAQAGATPVVIDADAINILAANPDLQDQLPPNSVITPHPGEMARLSGLPVEAIQASRIDVARQWAAQLGCTVVLKGARTVIAAPDGGAMVNPAATEALATGGSGDVLAGILAALLARGLAPFDAAVAGVFVHGRAGERAAAERSGPTGVLATEIAHISSLVLNELRTPARPGESLWSRPLPGSPLLVLPAVG